MEPRRSTGRVSLAVVLAVALGVGCEGGCARGCLGLGQEAPGNGGASLGGTDCSDGGLVAIADPDAGSRQLCRVEPAALGAIARPPLPGDPAFLAPRICNDV